MDATTELAQLANLLRLEREEDFRLHEIYLKQKSIRERKLAGITWFPLKINENGYGLGAYPFLVVENPGEKHKHHFQSASPVSLFSAAEGNDGLSINGTIGYVDDTKMKITFMVDELPDWIDDGKIGVNLLFDSKTFDEMFKALNYFINIDKGRPKELRDTLLGYRTPEFQKENKIISPLLNDSQRDALQTIVDAQDLAIVHGPPGTGKTTTLVQAIKELAKREKQVLVCTPSNAAADHLTRSLAENGVSVVRIGNLAKIESDTTAHTIDVLLQQEKEFKQIRELKKRASELRRIGGKYKRSFGREEAEQRKLIFNEAKNLNREAREIESYLVQKILDNAQAITCTLIGSAHDYLSGRKFKTVVIDEAGQGIEPAVWVPIMKAEKVVMAGDPFQLPPTVKSREAESKGLSVTLLEKTIQRHEGVCLLETQYRMNTVIMQFSNLQFYNGRLNAHHEVANWHLEFSPDVLEFIDTAGCGFEEKSEGDSESKSNPDEVQILRKHVEELMANGPVNYSVGIISPYRAQIDLLQEQFAELPNVVVNTIDSFQGQERDVIYLSLVRSNEKGEIGFLKDYRRMNVAMTRARKKLVIIGDSATLGNDRFYSDFLTYCEKAGAYRTAWQWMNL